MQQTIYIFDTSPKFNQSMLTKFITDKYGSDYEIEFPTLAFNGETYFDGSAYLTFQQNMTSSTLIVDSKTSTIPFYADYLDDKSNLYRTLYVLGFDKDVSKYHVMNMFKKYRVKNVDIRLSESKEKAMAVLKFADIHDRDLALLKAKLPNWLEMRLLPLPGSNKIEVSDASLTNENLQASVDLSQDFLHQMSFYHNEKKYICWKQNVKTVCNISFENSYYKIPDEYHGNFGIIRDYINGKKIVIDESNVIFCYKIGILLKMYNFIPKINLLAFINMNNVVLFANSFESIPSVSTEISSTLPKNSKALLTKGRFKLLPIKSIEKLFESVNVTAPYMCYLFLQTSDLDIDRTSLLKFIDFKNINYYQFIMLLKEKNVNFNAYKDEILQTYTRFTNFSNMIIDYTNKPFNGIIDYFKNELNANIIPDIITLEASSVQSTNAVENIISSDPNTYYSSKDFSNQWVKINFVHHTVSLSGYTYRTHNVSGNGHSKSWELSGSINGTNWIKIHEVVSSSDLISRNYITYVFQPTQFFKHLRITQKGLNSLGYNNFRIGQLEFFGQFKEDE